MNMLQFQYNNCLEQDIRETFDTFKQHLIASLKLKNFLLSLPCLQIVNDDEGLKKIVKLSSKFSEQFDNFCLIGTGGSSLGSRSLIGLLSHPRSKQFHFYDNIDPLFFKHSIEQHNLSKTGFIVISKSGSTPETIAQLVALLKIFEDQGLQKNIKENFIFITEDNSNTLNSIAKNFSIPTLVHNSDIGGRFSVFSNVGLFPAAVAGIDVDQVRIGAKEILGLTNKKEYNYHLDGSAMTVALQQQKNININVMLTYSDALKDFGMWYRQLWSESVGKNGLGTTPIHFVGTVDQHSQIQLYLDGPRDKFFTFISTEHSNTGDTLHTEILENNGMPQIAGKKMGDLMEAEQRATLNTLINRKLPIRQILIKKINAKSLGALMMHYFLETISAGIILNINIFDQPAVEESKTMVIKYLS